MLSSLLVSYNFVNSMVFSQLDHPLALTLIIIVQTLIICLTTGMFKQSYWFSYVLFLVFLGGMLVLFIYTTSLASNEIFSISFMELMLVMSIVVCLTGVMIFMDHFFQFLSNFDTMPSSSNSIVMYTETDNLLSKLYNTSTSMITLLLMSYLLLTLIVIVKITNIFEGPLRQKN
uniref:NADH-ubiquinone oxidoreductase chain 6 n=1 Tax=Conocephalus gladiatus TaxID=948350 RepID=A0A8F1NHW6_9ORTH|nr:NADH dehydrogenase subunit 6 [Conocephalus gladiatus]